MTDEQRNKIAEHLRGIGGVLTEIGRGDYGIEVQRTLISTMSEQGLKFMYTLRLMVHSQDEIQ